MVIVAGVAVEGVVGVVDVVVAAGSAVVGVGCWWSVVGDVAGSGDVAAAVAAATEKGQPQSDVDSGRRAQTRDWNIARLNGALAVGNTRG